MAGFTDGDEVKLNEMFKVKYAEKLERLYPQNIKFFSKLPFSARAHTGKSFQFPIVTSYEHGITYAANNAGAFDLNRAVPAEKALVSVDGTNIANRTYIGFEDAAKAVKGDKAFVNTIGYLTENLHESTSKRLEIMSFYGKDELGRVRGKNTGSATAVIIKLANTASATSAVASNPDAQFASDWASGIWAGMVGANIQLYANGGTTLRIAAKITKVDIGLKELTLGRQDGDTSTTINSVVANPTEAGSTGDYIVFQGALGKEFAGLASIAKERSSLFGVSNANIALFQGNVVSSTAKLSLGIISSALIEAIGKGLDEDLDVFVGPEGWEIINSDLAAKRRFEGASVPKVVDGFKMISYHYQGGMLNLISHTVVKDQDVFCLPMKRWEKVGASELTFNVPGIGEKFFLPLSSNMGYELRCWAHCAIFTKRPGYLTHLKGFKRA